MEEVIFIDPKGNIIQYDNICSHAGIAEKLIEENEELKQKFEESGCSIPYVFLMVDEGYLAVNVDPVYGMTLTANVENLTDIQRSILNNYLIAGAKLSSIDLETAKKIIQSRNKK